MEPLEALVEAEAENQLTPELDRLYGGPLAFREPVLYGNFVASIDGVVAIEGVPSAGSLISGRNEADRFCMGLLRALADAVVIGAGTMRGTPGHHWTAAHVVPSLAAEWAELRARLGRANEPTLVVVTASGELDASHPALVAGALVLTTPRGVERLSGKLPESCEVLAVGTGDSVDLGAAVELLRGRGMRTLLTEGGPHVIGQLLHEGLLDELFLTISPVVAGRSAEGHRLGLVEGFEFLPAAGRWARLVSLRRHGDFTFHRYRFGA